jgi:predicted Zn finger-like uncharacterized protein
MALIASCPHCGTHFRVTPRHLQAHGGDVRCGRCSHVFSAYSRLSTVQEPETGNLAAEPVREVSEVRESAKRVSEVAKPAKRGNERPVSKPEPAASPAGKPNAEPDLTVAPAETPPEAVTPEAEVPETAVAQEMPEVAEAREAGGTISETLAEGTLGPQSAEEEPSPSPAAQDEVASAENRSQTGETGSTEFNEEVRSHETEARGRDARGRDARGRDREAPPPDHAGEPPVGDAAARETHAQHDRPHDRSRDRGHEADAYSESAHAGAYAFETEESELASFAWSLGCLLLLIIFTGQTIYFYSADLARAAPATKPYLEEYCELMGCSVSPARPQQLLDIESSDMRSDPARPSIITLNATVRNHALYPQALPLFELTFIDAENRSLASRIFRPDMYLPPDANRTESIPPGKEFNVKLHLDTTDLNPAGYRLSLLYPPPDPQA